MLMRGTLLLLSLAAGLGSAASSTLRRTCLANKQVAMTYDDGPFQYQTQIAHQLNKHKAKGAFFVNGLNWGCIYDYAEELQQTYSQGHIIGSHTWTHADITKISDAAFNKELDKIEVALKKILNIKPGFFRPPYGSINAAKSKILKKRGYTIVGWNVDDEDSLGATVAAQKKTYRTLASTFPSSAIALNHEVFNTTKGVTNYALNILTKKGYKLVGLDQCLDAKPYQQVYSKRLPKRDASWKC